MDAGQYSGNGSDGNGIMLWRNKINNIYLYAGLDF